MQKTILTLGLIVLNSGLINAQDSGKQIKFGGRIMYDVAKWETIEGEKSKETVGTEFRRVRFFNSGKLFGNTNEMKKEIESLVKRGQTSVKEVQKQVDSFIKSAEKEFNVVLEKDVPKLVVKLKKERNTLEKKVESIVNDEIKKAKKQVAQILNMSIILFVQKM